MSFVAPGGYDNPKFMLQMLGMLWGRWFPDSDTAMGILTARTETYFQAYLDILDLVATKSRFDIPVFKSKYWSLLIVRESQKDSSAQRFNEYYTSGMVYQTGKPSYGDKVNDTMYSYSIDGNIKAVHAVYNRLINPSLIWMNNSDFHVDAGRSIISFGEDPFENDLIPKRDVLNAEGEVIDREIRLWLSLASWDMQYIYNQFGYALGIWMKSSTFYKEFISAIWDLLILGPTQSAIKLALSAITGIPFAEGDETVEDVVDESPKFIHVITDKNVYTFKPEAGVTVTKGDEITPGQSMCSALRVYEPQDGLTAIIPAFSLSSKLMSQVGLKSTITLENADVPVEYVGLDANNKAIVQFRINGDSQDIREFWRRAHMEGLRLGVTVGDTLDVRAVRSTPTTPADLPATVNPISYVLDKICGNNLYILYIGSTAIMDGAPGIGALDYLYKYLPAYTTYILYVEMPTNTDYYSVGSVTDTFSTAYGRELYDINTSFAQDIGMSIRAIPGRCR